MGTRSRILSADDVLDVPVPAGLSGYELVDGQLVPVMQASLLHARLLVEVARRLANHVIDHGLPGTVFSDGGVVLRLLRDPERMRAPDVMYVENSKLEGTNPERLFRVVPDLAIEIDLTGGKKPGGERRIQEYLEAGVRLVWAIDPETKTAMSYRPDGSTRLIGEDEELDGEEVVRGFRLLMAYLFGSNDSGEYSDTPVA